MKFLVLQHIKCEHIGLLGHFLDDKGIGYDIVSLYSNQAIPNLSFYQALVILGGPMNVYEEDKYPYLVDEHQAIKEAIQSNTPVLGICLGAQLIAKALGAKVSPNPTKEIGFYPISLTEEGTRSELFRECPPQFAVFQWHGDTFDIPNGATKLASSSLCSNQAFSYDHHAYALQFHVEVTPAMVVHWTTEYQNELKELQKLEEIPALMTEANAQARPLGQVARKIFSNFLEVVHNNQ
ncbi:MAG: type 1 glutamine amidotransferase [Chloroflexi bacterium]|nr:type 1 glutamine amidotransferase [Chloroflexota bacterium]